jgi:hypothetical protein
MCMYGLGSGWIVALLHLRGPLYQTLMTLQRQHQLRGASNTVPLCNMPETAPTLHPSR